jgi:uncharacterized repeat protein (TIGR03803 family)
MQKFVSFAVVGAALTLVACSNGIQNAISTIPGAGLRHSAERPRSNDAYEEVIYRFQGDTDGKNPSAGLIDVKGTLYGTTIIGGAHSKGTVYSLTPSGTETVLHSFDGADGANPESELIHMGGMLYGTTTEGGKHHLGTVFSITPSGKETVLHDFGGSAGDGANPVSGLVNVHGTLYGTTTKGGAHHRGTVFTITSSGTETVVHDFAGSPADGDRPLSGLIYDVFGRLDGTTEYGGSHDRGTVFAITIPSGSETLLHSFNGRDGARPASRLVYSDFDEVLYGTTADGGAHSCGSTAGTGCGTVFAITTAGDGSVVHDFAGPPGDGDFAHSGLIDLGYEFYGTTAFGGADYVGTIFSVSVYGSETVLHSFSGFDGAYPYAGLIRVGDKLYGTTNGGGTNDGGTVFAIAVKGD